jgi:hypothetical protein
MIEPKTKILVRGTMLSVNMAEKCGGIVYADITSGLTHYGTYALQGNVDTQFFTTEEEII